MPKILSIEDDPRIVAAIEKSLSLETGFLLISAADPQQAMDCVLEHKPDLILLDIKLPGTDGRVILKNLKQNAATSHIPVIFLTGLASEGDKVLGLNLGAEDYIVKPFGAMELLARVQTVLRRGRLQSSTPQASLEVAGLVLDQENRLATLHGKDLRLQPKEFEILYLLASQPGRTLKRSYLIENSSMYGLPASTRSLDTHIKNIRRKLGSKAHWIQTQPKLGYRFDA